MTPYEQHLRTMIKELDSKKHYDEPHMIYHDNVHTQSRYAVAGGNDMIGSGSFGKNGLPENDLKSDVIGKMKSKRGELVRKIMRDKKMTLPQASSYIKNNNM